MTQEARNSWMKARANCNAAKMFKRLREVVVRSDYDEASDACDEAPVPKGLEFQNDAENHFTVMRQPPQSAKDVRVSECSVWIGGASLCMMATTSTYSACSLGWALMTNAFTRPMIGPALTANWKSVAEHWRACSSKIENDGEQEARDQGVQAARARVREAARTGTVRRCWQEAPFPASAG